MLYIGKKRPISTGILAYRQYLLIHTPTILKRHEIACFCAKFKQKSEVIIQIDCNIFKLSLKVCRRILKNTMLIKDYGLSRINNILENLDLNVLNYKSIIKM